MCTKLIGWLTQSLFPWHTLIVAWTLGFLCLWFRIVKLQNPSRGLRKRGHKTKGMNGTDYCSEVQWNYKSAVGQRILTALCCIFHIIADHVRTTSASDCPMPAHPILTFSETGDEAIYYYKSFLNKDCTSHSRKIGPLNRSCTWSHRHLRRERWSEDTGLIMNHDWMNTAIKVEDVQAFNGYMLHIVHHKYIIKRRKWGGCGRWPIRK